MEKETRELIQDLATELGVRADHLWEVLITQAYVQGVINLVACGIIVIITVIGFVITYRRYSKCGDKCVQEDRGITAFIFALVMLVALCVCIPIGVNSITNFINPEYWALERILNKV